MQNVGQLSNVRPVPLQVPDLNAAQIQRRVELYKGDSTERVRSVSGPSDGLSLPSVSGEQELFLQNLHRTASSQQSQALVEAGHTMAQQIYGVLPLGGGVNAGTLPPLLEESLSHAAEQYIITTGQQNVDQVTTGLMYMAVDGVNNVVLDLAGELKSNLDAARSKREEIAEFRNTMADWAEDGPQTQEFSWSTFDGEGQVIEHTEELTRDQAEAKMSELEGLLQSFNDLDQDFQFRLQQAYQNQQQAMQLISNTDKMFHDTAKSILNNLRG